MAPSAITVPTAGSTTQTENGYSNTNAYTNGMLSTQKSSITNGHTSKNDQLEHAQPPDETLDLICIGFGPASLAIAIALHDAAKTNTSLQTASRKVLFLEKQAQFAWHAGMQLPGAKMQISFLKDLATPRDPTSRFTFLNYLFENGRLNHFINLGTFLPTRVEYEDYLRWCAGHFEREGNVAYGMEVEGVRVGEENADGKVTSFEVTARNQVGELVTRKAKRVVIAVGGRPVIPSNLQGLKHVYHSSQSAIAMKSIQANIESRPLRFAVVGSGQSAAEIFNDLSERFLDAQVRLIIKGASLRPSDDSPFVNEIFDPDRVDGIYNQDPVERAAGIKLDRATNYGVVRLELLEHLYEKLYIQRLQNPDETQWRCKIIPNRAIISAQQSPESGVLLKIGLPGGKRSLGAPILEEELEVDYVFTATGYQRNAHENMLSEVRSLLPDDLVEVKEKTFPVGRDYKIQYDEKKVDEKAGIWLQGCNERTHGLSDTLLSILAVRGGELIRSMFDDEFH